LTRSLVTVGGRNGRMPEWPRQPARHEENSATSSTGLSRQLSRVNETMTQFAHADSLADLVRQAPELLCAAGDFDRAMVSQVSGSSWAPAAVHVAAGTDDEANITQIVALRAPPVPLTGSLPETQVLRHRVPMLVEVPPEEATAASHTVGRLAGPLRSRAYVVAPVVIGDRVAGFLHADTCTSERELTVADRAGIQVFAAMFGLLCERAAMGQRLRDQQQAVTAAIAEASQVDTGQDAARLVRTQLRQAGHGRPGGNSLPSVQGGALTGREWEILRLLASGATNSQIASALVVSDNTVKSHIKRILRKLPAANRAEAVYRYTQLIGQLSPGPVSALS
jgi:LuxR family transcriptional regulator, regulator of acetate metabolism